MVKNLQELINSDKPVRVIDVLCYLSDCLKKGMLEDDFAELVESFPGVFGDAEKYRSDLFRNGIVIPDGNYIRATGSF